MDYCRHCGRWIKYDKPTDTEGGRWAAQPQYWRHVISGSYWCGWLDSLQTHDSTKAEPKPR